MQKGETVLSGAPHPGTPLQVLESPAGFYLGYMHNGGEPYTRETHYMEEKQAHTLLGMIRS